MLLDAVDGDLRHQKPYRTVTGCEHVLDRRAHKVPPVQLVDESSTLRVDQDSTRAAKRFCGQELCRGLRVTGVDKASRVDLDLIQVYERCMYRRGLQDRMQISRGVRPRGRWNSEQIRSMLRQQIARE